MTAALTDTAATADPAIAAQGITRSGTSSPITWTVTVDLKQTTDGWQGPADEISGNDVSTLTPHAGGTCTISITEGAANATITFS